MAHVLPPLPYAYNALEPVIDEQTMRLHHGAHHQAYVTNLNAAIAGTVFESLTIEELLGSLQKLPEEKRAAVRNNGGGHYNHTLFWSLLGKPSSAPFSGPLATALAKQFGSFDAFKEAMIQAGLKQFGSGWVWLVLDNPQATTFTVLSTPNQDTPLMEGKFPLLGIDVWEHAYYLKYQNRRAEYLKAIWQVISWNAVEERYAAYQANHNTANK